MRKKSFILYSIYLIYICLLFSCSSLKGFNAGVQDPAYVVEYDEKPVVAQPSHIVVEDNKELSAYVSNLEKLNESLSDEVLYYREQMEKEPEIRYVAIDSSVINGNEGTSEEIIYKNKQNSRVTIDGSYLFNNSITTYTFVDGQIYDIFFTPANVTDIRLEAEESVINIVIGNSNAWVCEQVIAMENGNSYAHILLRPVNTNNQSDCMIFTDKRVYYLRLVSTVQTAQMGVRWYYPYSGYNPYSALGSYATSSGILTTGATTATSFAKNVSDLNFNYKIEGEASWKPIRAYSDRERTYIQFANEFGSNSETPVVYLKQGNEESLVNFTLKGITYIIPFILSSNEGFVLRVGANSVVVSQAF